MKYPQYKPQEVEEQILHFWSHHKILEKIKKRNSTGKKFYFLEGPPYTSGRVHLGTAWNMALKDMFLRHKRMRGFNVWDRMGYDMHGLPTEHATEKKLNISGKEQITAYGVDKFVGECEKLCKENMEQMSKDFIRLGSTLDFSNPYQSITREFIDGEWLLIKKAHDSKRLYEGLRTMHWDMESGTGVAKHEIEYKQVTDNSVYIKFPLADEKKTFLLVWTTTPWTLPFNLGVMAHPDMEYLKCNIDGETWIVAKSRADAVIKTAAEQSYSILEVLRGKDLAGIKYIHPFAKEIPFFSTVKATKLHTVILSKEFVDDVTGTGLVHTAPGCGPEDYEVGHKNGLPPFNTTDEKGILHNLGPFTGLTARKDDLQCIKLFEKSGSVIATEKYTHDYPHDWRSHKPVIFRATRQWFFKVEDLKQEMIAANNKVQWHPVAGYNAFNSWLEHLRDNSISKQRYWGTPLPVWRNVDNDDDYIVVSSLAELEKLSGQKVKEPHKPWIDEIEIKKDGKLYKRVPDVLDVWVDAGTTSWNCIDYPKRKDLFENLFPADFILEGKDQIRGWFNLLMVAGFLTFHKPSFLSVYMHGFVTDVEGVKMSKSLGNVISPDEVINKHSADTFRYYSIQTPAGEDMNFSWEEVALKHRQLQVLWNVHNFLLALTKEISINPFEFDHALMHQLFDIPEKVIFSKLHSAMRDVTKSFELYHLDETVKPIEDVFLSLSRTYIQMVRDKSSIGSREEKELVAYTIAHVLLETIKLFAPAAPFITEAMFQNLKEEYHLKEESIHEYAWPIAEQKYINASLETDIAIADDIMAAVMHAREKITLNVRWPLKEIVVATSDKNVQRALEHLRDIVKAEINVKDITIVEALAGIHQRIRLDFAKVGPRYGSLSPNIIAKCAIESPESLLSKLKNDGAYKFQLDGTAVSLTMDDMIVEQDVPKPYIAAPSKFGMIYVNQQRTRELDAEGYTREIMRRVQALRKLSGLNKSDRISLYLKTGPDLRVMIEPFASDIKEKVGAKLVKIDILDSVKKHAVVSKEKVKTEEFTIHFDKV